MKGNKQDINRNDKRYADMSQIRATEASEHEAADSAPEALSKELIGVMWPIYLLSFIKQTKTKRTNLSMQQSATLPRATAAASRARWKRRESAASVELLRLFPLKIQIKQN